MSQKNALHRAINPSLIGFFLTVAAIAALTAITPEEKTLGEHVRTVYLHGAWVWTSLVLFLGAGAFGILGLLTTRQKFHCWSSACGRSGILFWVTYLPVSMWAAQANWNGMFLSEPRFRMAMIFAVVGLLLQLGLVLIGNPVLTSSANVLYIAALLITLLSTENVMHPPAPMLQSDFSLIQVYFGGLFILMILAAWQITRWLCRLETHPVKVHSSR
jgi:hypothetical protein